MLMGYRAHASGGLRWQLGRLHALARNHRRAGGSGGTSGAGGSVTGGTGGSSTGGTAGTGGSHAQDAGQDAPDAESDAAPPDAGSDTAEEAEACVPATETCNGLDDDCDGVVDNGDPGSGAACSTGLDGICSSGVEHCIMGTMSCVPDHGPGEVQESCNGLDDDCDGFIDEGLTTHTYYKDDDGDGYGTTATVQSCSAPPGYVDKSGDCNDNNADIHPGALELCNDIDDNCNGAIDEGVLKPTWYKDNDADGWGGITSTQACTAPPGYVQDSGDCNDFNKDIHPFAPEQCNNIDDDCNGVIDDGVAVQKIYKDNDGDGWAPSKALSQDKCDIPVGWTTAKDANGDGTPDWDCNDSSTSAYPGAPELCDGIINNCLLSVADQQCPTPCSGSWPANVGTTSGYVTIAQLDNDAEWEVVAIGGGNAHVFEHTGAVKWEAPCSQYYSHVSMADINGDGWLDVLCSLPNGVRALSGTDGALIADFTGPGGGSYFGVAAFDMDGDGGLDLVPSPYPNAAIYRLNASGALASSAALPTSGGEIFRLPIPMIHDLDGDGIAEIGLSSGNWACTQTDPTSCVGRMYWYRHDASYFVDSLTRFVVPQPAVGGEGRWGIVADLDADGAGDVYQFFSVQNKGFVWHKDGTGSALSFTSNALPILAPVDADYKLDTSGAVRFVNGPVADIDRDGTYEVLAYANGGLAVLKKGQVMDGYPVLVPGSYAPTIADLDRDGRMDVLYLGSVNGSVNCYELGTGSYDESRILTYGMGNVSRLWYRTGSVDPYEPNDRRSSPFNPATSTNPVRDSRAFSPSAMRDRFQSGCGWYRALRAAIAERDDRDFYVFRNGSTFTVALTGLVKDYDLYVHLYQNNTYVTTLSSTKAGAAAESITWTATAGPQANLFLVEVRGKTSNDFGPWPYALSVGCPSQ
jgi:hypothetical protein